MGQLFLIHSFSLISKHCRLNYRQYVTLHSLVMNSKAYCFCIAFSSLRMYNSQCRIFLLFCKDILDVYSQLSSCKYLNNCTKVVAIQIPNKRRISTIFHRRTKFGNFQFDGLRSETKINCFPSPVPLLRLHCLQY